MRSAHKSNPFKSCSPIAFSTGSCEAFQPGPDLVPGSGVNSLVLIIATDLYTAPCTRV